MCVCVCVRERGRERERESVCVCERERERERELNFDNPFITKNHDNIHKNKSHTFNLIKNLTSTLLK